MSSCKLAVMENRTVQGLRPHLLQSNWTVTDSQATHRTRMFWQCCSFFVLSFNESGVGLTWKSQTGRDSHRNSESWPCCLTQAITSPHALHLQMVMKACEGSHPLFPLTKCRTSEDLWKATFGGSEVLFCCFLPLTTDRVWRWLVGTPSSDKASSGNVK